MLSRDASQPTSHTDSRKSFGLALYQL